MRTEPNARLSDTPAFFEYCQPTFLDAWPAALVPYAPKTRLLYPSAAQTARLTDPAPWRGLVWALADPELGPLMAELQALIDTEFGGGAFVRTQVRSPKDAALFKAHAGRAASAWMALTMLRESSRFHQDCAWLAKHRAPLVIALRAWLRIPDWAQFRCIVRARRVVGISQFPGQTRVPEPMYSNPVYLHQFLCEFCASWIEALHLENVVADVVVPDGRAQGAAEPTAYLLDLNPFHRASAPGLFDWDTQGAFDGSMRLVR
jgi:hypothetical protein